MRFTGLEPLAAGFPHTEISSGEYRFDIHNTADLVRMGFDFERRLFDVEWRVENVLGSAYYGRYSTAVVHLRAAGLTAISGSGHVDVDPSNAPGIDFIEYIPQSGGSGALRFVFTTAAEISLTGSDCELRIINLE